MHDYLGASAAERHGYCCGFKSPNLDCPVSKSSFPTGCFPVLIAFRLPTNRADRAALLEMTQKKVLAVRLSEHDCLMRVQ